MIIDSSHLGTIHQRDRHTDSHVATAIATLMHCFRVAVGTACENSHCQGRNGKFCKLYKSKLCGMCRNVRPFTGKYLHLKQTGIYSCVVCGSELFSSDHKFESGCGWPAFSDILTSTAVTLTSDHSHGKVCCQLLMS